MKKPNCYLVGAIEAARDFGKGWRAGITPKLADLGYTVLDPCLFEDEQLKGMHYEDIPCEYIGEDGNFYYPRRWTDLKHAPRTSPLYKRYLKYMRKIVEYDIKLVENKVDVILAYLDNAALAGAGSHAEITTGFMKGIPIIVVKGTKSIPAWLIGCATKIVDTMPEALAELKKLEWENK